MKFEKNRWIAGQALKVSKDDSEKVDLVSLAIELYRPSKTKLLMEHYKLGRAPTTMALVIAADQASEALKIEKGITNKVINGEISVKDNEYLDIVNKRELSIRTMQNVIDRLNEIGWIGLEVRK